MWRRLTNVWPWFAYWKQSDAIRQLTDIQFEGSSLTNLKTAHRQTVLAQAAKYVSVCLSQTNIALCLNIFFRHTRPQVKTTQIGQRKESMWWRFWTTLVPQVVSVSDQCFKGYELEQQNLLVCLSVCLPQALYSLA